MVSNSSVRIALPDGDDGAVFAAFDQVAAKVFRELTNNERPDVLLQTTHTAACEVADYAPVAVKALVAIDQEPVLN